MHNRPNPRGTVRLRLGRGTVLLHNPPAASISCTLMDLSRGGCQCRASLDLHDLQTADAWQKRLTVGALLDIDVVLPPYVAGLQLQAVVRWQRMIHDHTVDLGLEFQDVTASQHEELHQALLATAGEKLRLPKTVSSASIAAVWARDDVPTHPPAPVLPPPPPPPPSAQPAPPVSPQGSGPLSISRVILKPLLSGFERARASSPSLPATASPDAGLTVDPDASLPVVPPPGPPPASAAATGALRAAVPNAERLKGHGLTDILIALGVLTPLQADHLERMAPAGRERLDRYLVRTGQVTPADLCRGLSLQSGIPVVTLCGGVRPEMLQLFSAATMEQYEFVPFEQNTQTICVAVARPLPDAVVQDLRKRQGKTLEVFLAPGDEIQRALSSLRAAAATGPDRRQIRYNLTLPVHYQFCREDAAPLEETIHPGQTINVNEGGFLIEGPAPGYCLPGDLLARKACVYVVIKAEEQSIMGVCRVCAVEESKLVPGTWYYGLRILNFSREDQRLLREIYIRAGIVDSAARRSGAFRAVVVPASPPDSGPGAPARK